MKAIANPPPRRLRTRLQEMFALHLQAHHLPHVRSYHAALKLDVSDRKAKIDIGKPRHRWRLPVRVVNVSQLEDPASLAKHEAGWLYFLNWGHDLPGIAEVRTAPKSVVLVKLSLGSSPKSQQAVLERFFKAKTPNSDLHCIEIPALHFRALCYVNSVTGKAFIVPLFSAIVPLLLGRRYSVETIHDRLKAGLEQRSQLAHTAGERLKQREELRR
jgi:hypothetical protein